MNPVLEKIHERKERTISAFCYASENFVAPWHFHPQYELTYIYESEGSKFIGDYVGLYHRGELVLLGSNLPHCWKNNISNEDTSISYVVQWEKGIYPDLSELASVHRLLKDASRGLIFNSDSALKLAREVIKLTTLEDDLLYAELLLLLVKLSKCNYEFLSDRKFTIDFSEEQGSRIARLQKYVEDNYGGKIYLSALAMEVNMTEQSVSRFFSKAMGRPFFNYLNEYRINSACRMLIDGSKSISEIAFSCGFESLPFFHKQFNKFKNTTPGRFRKTYRK